MLAALLINVAQVEFQIEAGRSPPNLIQWVTKRTEKNNYPQYNNVVKWIKKKSIFKEIASKSVMDKLEKSDIIVTNELLSLDNEEALILLLILMES